ncbi:MAG TPA: MFS transporter [Candidatus Acidoferrales bacterium]|nr:MFS transporter [Candidatus Acidoferrales bacterium]
MKQHNPTASASAGAGQAAFPLVREGSYLWVLLAMLASVTVFEGYDATIFHLCTPDIARTFHLDDRAVGLMASVVRLGGMLAFFVVMYSDRVGRKPVVAATVLFYTLFTLFTALSRGLGTFTLFQSGAQIFLSAEFGVAIIMISEEFPDSARGRGVAMLHAVGLLGVIAGGLLYGIVADSRWGWRGMYFIGILPLLMVAFFRRGIRETLRYEHLRRQRTNSPAPDAGAVAALRLAFDAFRGPYRERLVLVALLWNCVGLVGAPAVTFFSLYAKRDHHWTSTDIGHAVVIAYVIGTLGHALAGWMLDRVGRKFTTASSYVIGAVAILILFQSSTHRSILTAMVVTVVAFQAARTATATYSAELFPTEIRATSYSLTVNLFGQIAGLFTPLIIGTLSKSVGGLGNAVAIASIGPVIGAILIWRYAPETRAMRLEDVSPAAAAD